MEERKIFDVNDKKNKYFNIKDDKWKNHKVLRKYKFLNAYDIKSDLYMITNDGIVLSSYRADEKDKFYEMKKALHYKKYRVVKLVLNEQDKRRMFYVHRLVAQAFILKTKRDISLNRDTVHFIDWNKSHINDKNLMWVNNWELSRMRRHRDSYLQNGIVLTSQLDEFLLSDNKYKITEIMKLLQVDDDEENRTLLKHRRMILKKKMKKK